jgi:pimeloyl-ACP methyl ester carboxylesterase
MPVRGSTRRAFIAGLGTAVVWPLAARAQGDRTREIVAYDNVRIEVIAEGSGPLVVLLPSRGRDSEDFDEVAAGIAKAGFRVLRPQPRGAAGSSGPMQGPDAPRFCARHGGRYPTRRRWPRNHCRARLRKLGCAHDCR